MKTLLKLRSPPPRWRSLCWPRRGASGPKTVAAATTGSCSPAARRRGSHPRAGESVQPAQAGKYRSDAAGMNSVDAAEQNLEAKPRQDLLKRPMALWPARSMRRSKKFPPIWNIIRAVQVTLPRRPDGGIHPRWRWALQPVSGNLALVRHYWPSSGNPGEQQPGALQKTPSTTAGVPQSSIPSKREPSVRM